MSQSLEGLNSKARYSFQEGSMALGVEGERVVANTYLQYLMVSTTYLADFMTSSKIINLCFYAP